MSVFPGAIIRDHHHFKKHKSDLQNRKINNFVENAIVLEIENEIKALIHSWPFDLFNVISPSIKSGVFFEDFKVFRIFILTAMLTVANKHVEKF